MWKLFFAEQQMPCSAKSFSSVGFKLGAHGNQVQVEKGPQEDALLAFITNVHIRSREDPTRILSYDSDKGQTQILSYDSRED